MAFQSCKNPSSSWDVFLSFRGSDTRYNFTSHLYSALHRHGIPTFMDDHQLHSGEVITDALLQAIQHSKAYIVVLSENYASSRWCLDELVEILNCHKTMHSLVIPVFYNIDPSDVRYQVGSYERAFEKHQVVFETEKVNKWRLTLTQVAHFSGYHISQFRNTVLHGGWPPQAVDVVDWCDTYLPEFANSNLSVTKTVARHKEKWKPPDNGCLKINVDAATWTDNSGTGCHIVVRDCRGIVLAAKTSFSHLSFGALAAETLAIKEGLMFASHISYKDLWLESDCTNALITISRKDYICTDLDGIVLDIKGLSRSTRCLCLCFNVTGKYGSTHAWYEIIPPPALYAAQG